MRRFRTPSLFKDLEPDAYLFDTSAWLDVDSQSNSDGVWTVIYSLIDAGRLFTCAQVFSELREDPIYMLRLKQYEKALLAGDSKGSDPEYLRLVGKITHEHPAMSKATGSKTLADPYVVALAEIENFVVIANETTKRKYRKIPGVCEKRGVRCKTLAEFIAAEMIK